MSLVDIALPHTAQSSKSQISAPTLWLHASLTPALRTNALLSFETLEPLTPNSIHLTDFL